MTLYITPHDLDIAILFLPQADVTRSNIEARAILSFKEDTSSSYEVAAPLH